MRYVFQKASQPPPIYCLGGKKKNKKTHNQKTTTTTKKCILTQPVKIHKFIFPDGLKTDWSDPESGGGQWHQV